ncbi:extracellular solute-binding protein [Paenibacillus sp. HB172176]|uniref:extracellular solute-binding protein n=1 Tax=Paenibacillus sp. HB172176 TaxID=2493690 RepID=UPI001439B2FB|nr:extracellular solute-binding protein [Paenibacillus sp. HB172176]
MTVSPRKFAPLLVGALLLTLLLLLYFSQTANWNWRSLDHANDESALQPAGGQTISLKTTDLFVTVSMDAAEFNKLEALNKQFMNNYPYLNVKLTNESAAEADFAAWKNRSDQGSATDIMLLDNSWVIPFAVEGLLKPVDSLMTGDVLKEQPARLAEPLKWNGYSWGVPNDFNPYIMLWNKDMLEMAGLNEAPGNWGEWQKAVDWILSNSTAANHFLLNLSRDDLNQLLLWLSKFDAESSKELYELKALSDKQRERLLWLQSIPHEALVRVPLNQIYTLSDLIAGDELLAMMLPWDSYQKLSLAAQKKLIIDKDAIRYPWMNGSSFVISSSSLHENEAILWIQEMTRSETESLPVWWDDILGAKTEEGELLQPDPLRPVKWLQWETLWNRDTNEAFHLEAFAADIN